MNERTEIRGEFPLRGHPGVPAGWLAWAQPTDSDGTFALDRAGRPKVRRVRLRAEPPPEPRRPDSLLKDADWNWATSAPRGWKTIIGRFAAEAERIFAALSGAGCGDLEHDYRNGSIVEPPLRWHPHPDLLAQRSSANGEQRATRDARKAHAITLAEQLVPEWPGVAEALVTASDTALVWLVRAAEDLRDGVSHDGPRAFVQHHAHNTKAREDLPSLLADSGFEPEAIFALGVSRNPYIGLGGPIRAHLGDRTLDFHGWPGPHDLRLPASEDITVAVAPRTNALVILENRQAAETICDLYPAAAVIWCHGQPPVRVLRLIARAAEGVERTLICPDADLGGIRIAGRIHDYLPEDISKVVIDVGTDSNHVHGAQFSVATRTLIATTSQRTDQVGAFARACLDRGHAVEQEAAIRAALRTHLKK